MSDTQTLDYNDHEGIWLKVTEVQLKTHPSRCRVQLEGDKAHPRPLWWPVDPGVLGAGGPAQEIYKTILGELDKNRLVLARLTPSKTSLYCSAFTFQSAELSKRLS